MGVIDHINQRATQAGENAKAGLRNFLLFSCKIISGLTLGLTFSLIGQQVFQYGPLLFIFVILTMTSIFYKVSKSWNSIGLLIFDLLAILSALLIRMYVVVAPG